METELKLRVDPGDVDLLRRHPLLTHYASRQPFTRLIENTYFDTAGLDLRDHGLHLRVRRVGGRWLQTLKVDGHAEAGLLVRDEWETPVAAAAPDLPALLTRIPPESGAAQFLHAAGLAQALHAVVTTRYRRRTWRLRSAQGDEVELCIDVGEVVAGERSEPIAEVELELKAGRPTALFEIALALQRDVALRPCGSSKAERGLVLLAPAPPAPVGARRVELDASMTVGAAMRTIVGACLAQVEANEDAVRRGDQPEAIHQMRVGLRRLRTGLKLFEGAVIPPAEWQSELAWIVAALGRARDADVLADETLSRLAVEGGDAAGIEALRAAAHAAARRERQAAATAVASVRHARWQLGLMGWACAVSDEVDGSESLVGFARRMIESLRRKLIARGRHLGDGNAADFHRVRIAAKRLRYASEFFATFDPRHAVKRRLRALARLQDELGLINDAAVADGLLADLIAQEPEVAPPAAFARGWLAAGARYRMQALGKPWKVLVRDL
jgi:inorganic triphosphatase YgiF